MPLSDIHRLSDTHRLSARHRHGGGSGDGNRINYNDLLNKPSADNELFIPSGAFADNDANVFFESYFQHPCITMLNNVMTLCTVGFRVPAGKSTIVSMKLVFVNDNSSSNLYCKFFVRRTAIAGSSTVDSSDGWSTYAVGSNFTETITVPSAAYDGIGTLIPEDLIGLQIRRHGSSSSDTYNSDLRIAGLLVELS